jgi:NADH-quinone oxidoreductase subunit N
MDGGAVALVIIGLLNSGLAAAYYLRLAVVAAQRSTAATDHAEAPRPEVGIAVGAALMLAVAATLVLGIAPGKVLHSAQLGARTLEAPPPESTAPILSPVIDMNAPPGP